VTAVTAVDAPAPPLAARAAPHPETAFTEHATSGYVATELRALGFDVVTGVGGTGVVGSLTRGGSRQAVGLRCELDALPIPRQRPRLRLHSRRPHARLRPRRPHGDGPRRGRGLAEHGAFDGTVRVLFQPAEEPGQGAQTMLDDGLLERFPIDRLYGLHNMPGMPAGHLLTRAGPIMASEDDFAIHLHGRGGHASAPHLVIDPLVVGAEVVVALQHVVARSVDPVATAVLSCTDLRTDGARNAIPSNVHITGDTAASTRSCPSCSSAASARSPAEWLLRTE
jgi:hippurate hydrolase